MATTLEQVLHGRDTISSKDAKVTVTIDGNVINLIDCKELKITIKRIKKRFKFLAITGLSTKPLQLMVLVL